MDGILASLTDSQRQAVQHVDGPLLILAGPGSGKTRVVTHRVAYLREQGIPDEQIVALTFTNKAADEMRLRLDRLAPGCRVWMGTFHRFCSRLLRQYASLVGLRENFSIYDTDDSQKLLREAIDDAQVELVHETPVAHRGGHQLGEERLDRGRSVPGRRPAIRSAPSSPASIRTISSGCSPPMRWTSTTC